MRDLITIQQAIRQFCDDRNWDQFHNLKDLLISLNLEAAEALEHVQWKNDQELVELTKNNAELGEELADVLYWVILIANKANVDLAKAFEKKMEKNASKYPVARAYGSHKKYTELS